MIHNVQYQINCSVKNHNSISLPNSPQTGTLRDSVRNFNPSTRGIKHCMSESRDVAKRQSRGEDRPHPMRDRLVNAVFTAVGVDGGPDKYLAGVAFLSVTLVTKRHAAESQLSFSTVVPAFAARAPSGAPERMPLHVTSAVCARDCTRVSSDASAGDPRLQSSRNRQPVYGDELTLKAGNVSDCTAREFQGCRYSLAEADRHPFASHVDLARSFPLPLSLPLSLSGSSFFSSGPSENVLIDLRRFTPLLD